MATRTIAAALALWTLLPLAAAAAERAWVRGAPLNLRTGAGTQYRIVGVVQPGDGVAILEREERWTRIRTDEGKDGWISAGYLDPTPPPALRVEQLEGELARTREQLDRTQSEASQLRSANEAYTSSDEEQRSEIERLTRDNYKLRAGQRWTEWIIGASILGMGMIAGAILSRISMRRSQRRLRL